MSQEMLVSPPNQSIRSNPFVGIKKGALATTKPFFRVPGANKIRLATYSIRPIRKYHAVDLVVHKVKNGPILTMRTQLKSSFQDGHTDTR